MVGAGVGAREAGSDAEAAEASLDTVARILSQRPDDLPAALADALDGQVRERAVNGASLGVSAISLWDRLLLTRSGPASDRELVKRAVLAWKGQPGADSSGWPAVEHLVPGYQAQWPNSKGRCKAVPQDEGLYVGDVGAVSETKADAVVSLCRMGTRDVPQGAEHIEVWLVDEDDPAKNPNLDFVLQDAAETIGKLRDEGNTVLLHCVQAESRTPAVTAAYLCTRFGTDASQALSATADLLPGPGSKAFLRSALLRLWP